MTDNTSFTVTHCAD